jgi:hypothetical protein
MTTGEITLLNLKIISDTDIYRELVLLHMSIVDGIKKVCDCNDDIEFNKKIVAGRVNLFIGTCLEEKIGRINKLGYLNMIEMTFISFGLNATGDIQTWCYEWVAEISGVKIKQE